MTSFSVLIFFVFVSLVGRFALSATTGDIKGSYSLSKAGPTTDKLCPQFIRHTSFKSSGAGGGYIRIFHNSIEVSKGVKCNSTGDNSFTVLLDSTRLEAHVAEEADLFPLASNEDRGLLNLLIKSKSIVGTEALGDRVCGNYTFRKGTIVAFVRDTTKPVPELGLSNLLDGDKYLLMFENNVKNPKRCVYRSQAVLKATNKTRRRPDCFPASASVSLHDGSTMRMDALNHGTRARIAQNLKSSSVIAFSHRDASVNGEYMRFTTENGAFLTVSPGHYVFSNGFMKVASSFRVGDVLDMEMSSVRVTHVEEIVREPGLFNPHTSAGEIIVNGFRVSCYTSAVHPYFAHKALAPIRLLWRITGGWSDSSPVLGWLHTDNGIHSVSSWVPSGPSLLRW